MMRTAFKPKKPAQSERGKERGGRSGQRHVRSETANTITNRSLLDACPLPVSLRVDILEWENKGSVPNGSPVAWAPKPSGPVASCGAPHDFPPCENAGKRDAPHSS